MEKAVVWFFITVYTHATFFKANKLELGFADSPVYL